MCLEICPYAQNAVTDAHAFIIVFTKTKQPSGQMRGMSSIIRQWILAFLKYNLKPTNHNRNSKTSALDFWPLGLLAIHSILNAWSLLDPVCSSSPPKQPKLTCLKWMSSQRRDVLEHITHGGIALHPACSQLARCYTWLVSDVQRVHMCVRFQRSRLGLQRLMDVIN